MRTLAFRLAFLVVAAFVSFLSVAYAQRFPVVGYDAFGNPVCMTPRGVIPCAALQQVRPPPILPIPQQMPRVRQFGTSQGAQNSPQLNGSPQNVAIGCAQRTGADVSAFSACVGGNVILPENQQAVLNCALSSTTQVAFAECAAPQLGIQLNDDQRAIASCAMSSDGDEDNFVSCAGSAITGNHLTPNEQAVLSCAQDSNGDAANFASCSASSIIGPRLTTEQRVAVECAAESNGDSTDFAACAGTKFLNVNLNAEQRIALGCVVETGGQPYAAAGCMASRLTLRELEKCANGFGTSDGCFGPNNDIVGRHGWVARNLGQVAGGPNSVINNPGQLTGGPNSIINNPGQLTGGPNSIINNPGQVTGGRNSVINNPGQLTGGRNSVINNPGQLLPHW